MKLTDGQIAEYEERGFLVFPDLVEPARNRDPFAPTLAASRGLRPRR